MKHSIKITAILLVMFFLAQLIGIGVLYSYSPRNEGRVIVKGNITNDTNFNLPYGFEPPKDIQKQNPWSILLQLVIAFAIVIVIYLVMMKFGWAPVLKGWFFIVITIALAVSINAALRFWLPYSALISFVIGLLFASLKVFKRNIIFHNITELLVYPGIAALIVTMFLTYTNVPLLLVSLVLIVISLYDIYAVWHAGFMQKMAKYQIQKIKVFAGFFVPYVRKEDRILMKKARKKGSKKIKVKATLAILGGGDVVWPMLLVGIIFLQFGLLSAVIIALGATLALFGLFTFAKKGKFYPAMPFISAGCFIALGIVYLINYI